MRKEKRTEEESIAIINTIKYEECFGRATCKTA